MIEGIVSTASLSMPRTSNPSLPIAILLGYLSFIVYGSLVPLDFQAQSLEAAWKQFQQTPMLALGVDSRADWIANGVLYFPAGVLAAEWLSGLLPPRALLAALIAAFIGCCTLAVGVEFTQVFFPARTVSLNDILAECVGSLAGVALAPLLRRRLRQLVAYRPASREAGVSLLLSSYLMVYLAYSLFPYDFLLSGAEFAAKIKSDSWGILLAGSREHQGIPLTLLKLALEIVGAVPFGIFMIRRSAAAIPSPLSMLLSGALLALGIEVAQLFIYSGTSQGLSVITRALGSYAGARLWLQHKYIDDEQVRAMLRRASFILVPAYLLGLATVDGWFSQHWQSVAAARVSLDGTHLLPFYYHYYTSEALALTSMVSIAAMFAPVGLLAWAWSRPGIAAAGLAALLALALEASRLFFANTHADPTNLLIAAAAAWTTLTLVSRLFSSTAAFPGTRSDPGAALTASHDIGTRQSLLTIHSALTLLVAAGFSAYWLTNFPVQPLLLALGLAACAAASWFKPIVIVALIPAALPILDLAPWSGRFFFDEFDLLLLVTLAVGYASVMIPAQSLARIKALDIALGLLLLSFAIGSVRALLPLPAVDANSFSGYFSQFNALRIGKGLVSAMLFMRLVRRLDAAGEKSFDWFAWGMTFGLAATVSVIFREKLLFGGLLDFSSGYRATGPFSAIHTGGAYVEGYLSVAAPFAIYLTLQARSWLRRVLGVALLLASTYALMATVARSGFAAFPLACILALVTTFAGQTGIEKRKRLAVAAMIFGTALTVAVPLFLSSFTQQRMSQVPQEIAARRAHWADGLAIRDHDTITDLFGMGIGRFPNIHYWRSREDSSRTSIHSLVQEGSNNFLRIAPGSALYVEQIVTVEPHRHYLLSFDLRSATPATTIGLSLCEKWMLASSRCAAWQASSSISKPNTWQHFEYTADTEELGSGDWFGQPPVKLSFVSNGTAIADIDNIRLRQVGGAEILRNGDFSRGMDRWYFATDVDLAWHLHSTPVEILFDQGWFGILAFGVFLATALGTGVRAAWSGSHAAGIAMAATSGFLAVSVLGSLIDAPRFLFLLLSVALFTGLRVGPTGPRDLPPVGK